MTNNNFKNPEHEEELIRCYIPINFVDTGKCFNGLFRKRNFVEAIIVTAPIFLFFVYTLNFMNFENFQMKLMTIIFTCLPTFLFFVIGINNESVFEFCTHLILFYRNRRVIKYNPRVKYEVSPNFLYKEKNVLPRDRLLNLLKDKFPRINMQESSFSYNPRKQDFFEDDIGIVELDIEHQKFLRKKDQKKFKKIDRQDKE